MRRIAKRRNGVVIVFQGPPEMLVERELQPALRPLFCLVLHSTAHPQTYILIDLYNNGEESWQILNNLSTIVGVFRRSADTSSDSSHGLRDYPRVSPTNYSPPILRPGMQLKG